MRYYLFYVFFLISFVSMAQWNLVDGEYFYDTDPGLGNGNAVLATDGNFDEMIEKIHTSKVNSLSVGVHSLNVRVKDDLGNWGNTFTVIFNTLDSFAVASRVIALDEGEFFWDTDPGAGNGSALLAFDGNFDEAIEAIYNSTSNLPSPGAHKLGVRVRGGDGVWGPTYSTVVNVLDPLSVAVRSIKVDKAEFFWDTDPGAGNGSSLLAFDGNFDDAIEAVYNSTSSLPSPGAHKLGVRVKDGVGNWGPTFSVVTNILDSLSVATRTIEVSKGEYFFDTDPGAGSASSLLAFDGNFDDAIETVSNSVSISNLNPGAHTLNVRVRDGDNNWGPVFTTVFNVLDNLTNDLRDIAVVAGEGFWDTDPGLGNGTPFIAFDGNFNEATEVISGVGFTGTLTVAAHTYTTRVKGQDGLWGPDFTVVVQVLDALTPQIDSVFGPNPICSGGTSGQTYFVDSVSSITYTWTVVGGNIAYQSNGSVTVDWIGAGPYSVSVKGCNNWGCDSTATNILIGAGSAPTATAGSDKAICAGDSVTIGGSPSASGGQSPYAFNWSNAGGLDNSIIANPNASPAANTNYILEIVDANGCSAKDTVSVTVNSNPIIGISSNASACLGSSINLNSNVSSGTAPYNYNWTPASGLSCTNCASPSVTPTVNVTYDLAVSDANSCVDSQTVNITVNPAPNVFITDSTDASCGQNDGESIAGVTGGTPNYTFLWSSGSTSAQAQNLAAGNYNVTVTDSKGCTDVASVSIGNIGANIAVTSVQANTAGTSCIGYATANASGGQNPYAYVWSTNPIQSTATATGLCIGTYYVTATDVNGCAGVDTVTIVDTLATNVTDVNLNEIWSVYPNPSNGEFVIQYDGSNAVNYVIFNMIGQNVNQGSLSSRFNRLKLGHLPSGSYILQLQDIAVEPKRIIIR